MKQASDTGTGNSGPLVDFPLVTNSVVERTVWNFPCFKEISPIFDT